jgi:hypothetical protein
MTEPDVLTLADAAALLGITEQELMLSRARGLAPGSLGYRQGGEVRWNRADLTEFAPKPKSKPRSKPKPPSEE